MSNAIPQHILDSLTDVHLPRNVVHPAVSEIREIDGFSVPFYRTPAVVLGSGAAGLRAAVELKRRATGERVELAPDAAIARLHDVHTKRMHA